MVMKTTIFLLMVSLLSACQKDQDVLVDADGVATRLPYLSKTSISDDAELAQVAINTVITYGQNVLIGGQKNKNRSLISLDGQDGTKNWEWVDLFYLDGSSTSKDPIQIDSQGYHLNNYSLFFQSRASNYCLDLQKGQTIWKAKVDLTRFSFCYGIGNLFFYGGKKRSGGYEDDGLYFGNTAVPESNQLLLKPAYQQPAKQTQYQAGYILGFCPFVSSQGDTLVALTYADPKGSVTDYPPSMAALYNFSQRKWIYDRKNVNLDGSNGSINYPRIYKDRVYYAGRGLQCYDALTGEKLWSFSTPDGYTSFRIIDGKLLANCENRYTYCLDPETGQQLWREQSSGSCSNIAYLNGVIYFLGGGDGKLHALDAQTGKHLWRLDSPDRTINSGAFFYGTCAAVPSKDGISKGRVIATTGLNAYGYEAAK
jgi:outer membrane protein assembly factor BamB